MRFIYVYVRSWNLVEFDTCSWNESHENYDSHTCLSLQKYLQRYTFSIRINLMTTTEVGWRACESQVLVMDKLMNYIWIRSNRVGSIKKNHMITLQPWDNVAKCNSDDNCCRLHVRGRLYTIHVFYDFIFSRWYAITVPFSREIEMHLYHFVGFNIC